MSRRLVALTMACWALVSIVLYAQADLTTRPGRAMACTFAGLGTVLPAVLWGYWQDDLTPIIRGRIRLGLLAAGPLIWLIRWVA